MAKIKIMSGRKIIIKSQRTFIKAQFREIIQYKDLLYFLVLRDLKVRYKQTVIGSAWAILQPFIQMVVFSIFFGKLAGIPSDNAPYPIFVYSALLPWTFFANALTSCNNSIIGNSGLITKVYFPRLIIPLSAVSVCIVDLLLSFVVLIGVMWYYHFSITVNFIMILPLFLATIFTVFGIGTLLAALSVTYRDFRHIVPFGIQIWLFATPVIYPSSIVGAKYQFILNLNPMAGLISGFRSAILNKQFDWGFIGVSFSVSMLFFVAAILYFNRVEKRFADII